MTDDLQSIEAQIADLQKKKKAILTTQKVEKLKELKSVIDLFGFTAAELGLKGTTRSNKKKASASKAKYANPKDPTQTWSGKGREPKWMADHKGAGGTKDDLLITKTS